MVFCKSWCRKWGRAPRYWSHAHVHWSNYTNVKTAAPVSKHGLHEDSTLQVLLSVKWNFFLCFRPLFNIFRLSFLCLDYFLCGNRLEVFDLSTSQGLGRDDRTGQREGEGRKEGRKGCVIMIELDSRKDQVFCLVSLGNKSYLHLGCSVWSYY